MNILGFTVWFFGMYFYFHPEAFAKKAARFIKAYNRVIAGHPARKPKRVK
jgi:hypothetical protein